VANPSKTSSGPVYVPVTLRQPQARAQARGNLVGQIVVPLPIGVPDPGRRLAQIAAETATRKAGSHPSLGAAFRSRTTRRVLLKVLDRYPVNVTTADVPGPQTPLCLAGARLLEIFPLLPLISNVSLGVGALSCAGQFNIVAIADQDACPARARVQARRLQRRYAASRKAFIPASPPLTWRVSQVPERTFDERIALAMTWAKVPGASNGTA
jgi:diacylglycerol O-acyltransferase